MKLTEHFYLAELIESDYAERHGIKNLPSPATLQNLQVLANALEHVRLLLGKPMTITSGYRNPELNRAIGGSKTSAHMTGFAADFKCFGFGTPKQIVMAIKASDIQYDQLILEGVSKNNVNGAWVHFSIAEKMRRVTLLASFEKNKVVYNNFS